MTPAALRPMTAVEQRGPRVYASPMAKRLAEAQQLRLEGEQLKELITFTQTFLICDIYRSR